MIFEVVFNSKSTDVARDNEIMFRTLKDGWYLYSPKYNIINELFPTFSLKFHCFCFNINTNISS